VFSPKNSPIGSCDNIGIHLGDNIPNNTLKGNLKVNRQFQADKPNGLNIRISKTGKYKHDQRAILGDGMV